MKVKSGSRLRWRVLNMARSRYLELQLEGHDFLRIGDDAGLMEFPVEESTSRIVPGERVDLIVEPHGKPGESIDLVTLPVYRGTDASTATEPIRLIRLDFVKGTVTPPKLPRIRRSMEEFPTENAEEVELALTMDVVDGEAKMGLDWVPPPETKYLQVKAGTRQIWNVVNHSSYAHPFHLHGFHFEVLDEDGNYESPLRYQDTVDIPPRETLRFVPRLDDRPGMWMFHCHILDHAESGMMSQFEVL
jgi:FtsP/CotA-like multicopper oxidase with cupredoxin domain